MVPIKPAAQSTAAGYTTQCVGLRVAYRRPMRSPSRRPWAAPPRPPEPLPPGAAAWPGCCAAATPARQRTQAVSTVSPSGANTQASLVFHLSTLTCLCRGVSCQLQGLRLAPAIVQGQQVGAAPRVLRLLLAQRAQQRRGGQLLGPLRDNHTSVPQLVLPQGSTRARANCTGTAVSTAQAWAATRCSPSVEPYRN